MKTIRLGLIAGAGVLALTTLSATRAAAFGPTCIPRLENCMCTYRVPCPVNDLTTNLKSQLKLDELRKVLEVTQEIKDPQAMLLKIARGDSALGVPGMDSIGIDLDGILSGDLSSLGLPEQVTQISGSLGKFGLTPDTIVNIATGKVSVDEVLDIAVKAGLDMPMLEKAGLSIDTIRSLAAGELDVPTVLGLAKDLGLQGNILRNLGIDEALLVDIANGVVDPDRIAQIARNAGVDLAALENVGLDMNALRDLAGGNGSTALVGILQKAGLDSSVLTDLGVDTQTLARIASGELPKEAISALLQGTGIDPNAITIPGLGGPISLDNLRPEQLAGNVLTIPAADVAGLSNVLDSAGSAGAPGQGAAMCSGDQSLISVAREPNAYGDDMATIDMAISGNDLTTFAEAREEVASARGITAGTGFGRAIVMRPLLESALASIDGFDDLVQNARTVQDDLAINDTIRARYMTAKAETASMYSALLSVRASNALTGRVLSPTPLYPQNSVFQQYAQTAIAGPADSAIQAAEATRQASGSYSDFIMLANEALLDHNLISKALDIQDGLAGVTQTIDDHEAIKRHLVELERVIRAGLAGLYPGNADPVWTELREALERRRGDYFDKHKYEDGLQTAMSLSRAVTSGRSTLETPYHYANIDDFSARIPEPYRITPREALLVSTGEGDAQMPPGLEFVGAFQYYLETLRRLDFYGPLRRGDTSISMTSRFWTEMYENARECLSGPLPSTAENITERPELFDISKNCTHLVWEGADQGDYIDPSNLGGADAALWLSKITIDRVASRTGGAANAMVLAQKAIDMAEKHDLAGGLEAQGRTNEAEITRRTIRRLKNALGDTSFASDVGNPG